MRDASKSVEISDKMKAENLDLEVTPLATRTQLTNEFRY